MFMLLKILAQIICFYVCLAKVEATPIQGRLHLFMVGDVNPNEQVLQSATTKDLAAIRKEVEAIANHAQLEFLEKSYLGFSVRAKRILTDFKNLTINSKDLIFFYFSGHGYTTLKQNDDPWPNLSFSGDRRGLPLSRIIKIARELKPRFTIIFADCCNTLLGDDYAPILLKPAMRYEMANIQSNYKKMFLAPKGIVIIAGSTKAQPSLATQAGSFCTIAFLKSLHEKINGPEDLVDWQALLDLTTHNLHLKAQEYNREQNMIFSIE